VFGKNGRSSLLKWLLAISKGFCETMRILPKDSEFLGFRVRAEKWWKSSLSCVFIPSKNGEKASSHLLDDDLESIHLVESNELMQMDGKWLDFMTMLSKESWIFWDWGAGEGVVGVSHLFDLEKYDFYRFRGFLRKNLVLNSPYFDFFRSPYFYTKLQQVAKILKDSEIFLLSHLGYSQTWLNLIANDRQFGYITNLEKEKENPWWANLQHFVSEGQPSAGLWRVVAKDCRAFKAVSWNHSNKSHGDVGSRNELLTSYRKAVLT
jgi:hypothetical protein